MNKYSIPTTSRQAFKVLDAMLSVDDVLLFSSMSTEEFCIAQHFGLGLWIRNKWIFTSGEESAEERLLLEQCYRMLAGDLLKKYYVHPDDVSGHFLKRYHRHLKKQHLKFKKNGTGANR